MTKRSNVAPIAASTISELELRKCPAGNECARDSYDEVAEEAKACTLDDLASKPAGGDAANQYNEKAFAGKVHFGPSSSRSGSRHAVRLNLIIDGRGARIRLSQRAAAYLSIPVETIVVVVKATAARPIGNAENTINGADCATNASPTAPPTKPPMGPATRSPS
jgi:hypothetical protein